MKRTAAILFGIDVRTLAAFRIGLGILLLADLAIRATDLVAHYTDRGVLPRAAAAERFDGTWRWSVHMLGGSWGVQALLFVLAAAAAVCLAIGWKTRLATIVCWLLTASLHVRNPLVINAGDELLRMLLFWSMFLPLGSAWSIDRFRRGGGSDQPVVSAATAAIMLQVCMMYWMTGYFKLYGAWHSDDCLARILQFDSYARPMARALLPYPTLLAWLGWAVLWSELVGPLLLFSPLWTKPLRLMVMAWFLIMHLGIEVCLTVGLFSYVSGLAWMLFLPDSVWNGLARFRRARQAPADPTHPHGPPPACRFRRANHVASACVLLLIGYVVLWNLSTMRFTWAQNLQRYRYPRLADVTALRQKWDMFWSVPLRDGWYVLVGRLEDGRTVDLLRGGKTADWDSYEKPICVSHRFPNHRWRKLYRRLISDSEQPARELLCQYLARVWNESHNESSSIAMLEMQYMEEVGSAVDSSDRLVQRSFHCLVVQPKSPALRGVPIPETDANR